MVETIIFIAFICAGAEIMLMQKCRWLEKLLSKHKLLPFAFSFVLSIMLGTVFGAAGFLVMMGGMLSTVIVQPYYWLAKCGGLERLDVWIKTQKQMLADHAAQIQTVLKSTMAIVAIPITIIKLCFVTIFFVINAVGKVAALAQPKPAPVRVPVGPSQHR